MVGAPKSGPIEFRAVPYDRESHEGFLCSSWTNGARRPFAELQAWLRKPATRCAVAHIPGDPDSLLGWAAADYGNGALIWIYVRDLHGHVRRRGLGTELLWHVGFGDGVTVPSLYWSPHASAIAAAGKWHLVYQPKKLAA